MASTFSNLPLWIGGSILGLILLANVSSGSPVRPMTTPSGTLPGWTDDDFRALDAMAKRLRMKTPDLLLVLYAESGLKPNAAFPGNLAVGLNQITRSTAHALGISDDEYLSILNKSVTEQIPYIERYFRNVPWVARGNPFQSATQIYQANFAPATLFRGSSPEIVLYTQAHDGQSYTLNSAFDVEKKGYITVGDLGRLLERRSREKIYLIALGRLRAALGDPSLQPFIV